MSDRKHHLQQPDIITALTREGVLIHVSIRYWRGCRKLDAPDLGIQPGQVNNRLVSLGHKRLLPKETLAPLALIEGRVHALVENNTFSFLGGLARFLPSARIADVQSSLAQFEREFQQARQEFLNQYQHNRDTALREWRDMATRLSSDPEQLIHTIQQSYPPAHKLEKTFGFDVRLFQVSAAQDISLQMLDLGEQNAIAEARRQAASEATTRIRQEPKRSSRNASPPCDSRPHNSAMKC